MDKASGSECFLELVAFCRKLSQVLDLAPVRNLTLRGGFRRVEVRLRAEPLVDSIERAATAQTVIRGATFHIFLRADLDQRELSLSLYHEVLEAAMVASDSYPLTVVDFNEADFERAARSAHQKLGIASPVVLNEFWAEFGF